MRSILGILEAHPRSAEATLDGRVMAPEPGRTWFEIGVLVFLLLPILTVAAWVIYPLFRGVME